jgi:hypothetical protein
MQTRTGIIALVVITVITYFFLFSGFFTPEPLTEAEIRDLVRDRYPNSLGDPEYDEDCIICDATGCHPYGEPCWKVTRTGEDDGKTSIETSVDESGNEIASTETPCTEWWCDAEPCSYEYSELVGNVTHEYTNYGCDNPSPTCDQEFGLCRMCTLSDECVMTETYKDNLTTVYIFSVIGTEGYSVINDSGYVCQVFEGEDMLLMNTTTISECRMIAEFYSKCGVPGCRFEPSFGMIPY